MSISALLFASSQVNQVLFVLFIFGTWHYSLCSAGLNSTTFTSLKSFEQQPNPLGVIMPALVIVMALGTMVLPFFYQYLRSILPDYKPPNDEPEVQVMLNGCTETDAKYEYEVIFHVGCPTKTFKMKHAYIDFQLRVHPSDAVFGTPTRFSCSKLPDLICSEMHLFIGSATPIGQITGIEANHNMKNGFIFLYDCVLIELASGQVIDVHRIDEYITKRTDFYRRKVHLNNDTQDRVEQFPQLPLNWSTAELHIMACVLMLFNACAIMTFEYTNLYFWNRAQEGSLYRSLTDIAYATPLGLVFISIVAICYKYYLKKKAIQAKYAVFGQKSKCWQITELVYLAGLITLSLIMAACLVYLGLHTSLVKSLYWLCSWLVVTIITFGVWANANSSVWFRNIFDEKAPLDKHTSIEYTLPVYKKFKRIYECPADLNTNKPTTKKDKSSPHQNDSICGRKMLNPNKQTYSDIKQSSTIVEMT